MQRLLILGAIALTAASCRIERVSPREGTGPAASADAKPTGDLWVYTSMYPAVIDALDPLVKAQLPDVTVHWFKGGSEKVANRLETELAAGGTQADILATSDPFHFERLKRDGRLLRYASPNGLRTPRSLIDPDGHFAAMRVSTMVLAYRRNLANPPSTWRALSEPEWKGRVAIGDPLVSGTSFTWSVFLEQTYGPAFFASLRANGAVVAGGNAAVQQKVESGEADVGVLLLENVLFAQQKGSELAFAFPDDGAVTIPGGLGILATSRNRIAAQALVDLLLSPEGQRLMRAPGEMHAVDPREPGPSRLFGVEELVTRAQPWTPAILERGALNGQTIKATFSQAFAR